MGEMGRGRGEIRFCWRKIVGRWFWCFLMFLRVEGRGEGFWKLGERY